MIHRTFGRMGWSVSEIGYGMWGLAGWTGSDETESQTALEQAVALGCNFFDTAWAYGSGRSEQILGGLLKNHPGKTLYVTTKIPPKKRNGRNDGKAGVSREPLFAMPATRHGRRPDERSDFEGLLLGEDDRRRGRRTRTSMSSGRRVERGRHSPRHRGRSCCGRLGCPG